MSKQQAICAAMVDRIAGRYLDVLAEAEDIKKQLLRYCRLAGFTPKDAPKTKMLAGELYEVLASRATRTVVDQVRARALREKLQRKWGRRQAMALISARVVFDLAEFSERAVENMPAWVKQRFAEVARQHAAGTRLTVRKRKQVAGKKAA